jgi:hypothetical protein
MVSRVMASTEIASRSVKFVLWNRVTSRTLSRCFGEEVADRTNINHYQICPFIVLYEICLGDRKAELILSSYDLNDLRSRFYMYNLESVTYILI